jgi:hypothetical protein
MASYSYNPDPSLSFSNQGVMDLFKTQDNIASDSAPQFTSQQQTNGAIQSGRASAAGGGGLGGALTSGGTTAAMMGSGYGLPVAAAGMLISAVQQNKKDKADRAQRDADNENAKRQNLINIYQQDSSSNFGLS